VNLHTFEEVARFPLPPAVRRPAARLRRPGHRPRHRLLSGDAGAARRPGPLLTDTHGRTSQKPLNAQLEQWSASRALPDIDPALALAAITTWSRLHGLASLEIEGTYTSMGIDADLLYDAEVTAILTSLGQT